MDTQKGSFLLVCGVIATQMLVVTAVVGFCTTGIALGSIQMGACRDLHDDLINIFNMSFTAAIAFAGGRYTAPSVPEPKLPEKQRENT